ncbi:MAG TPA: hypothetical protein VM871_01945 [Flavisolibacter sp.]|nr:hypothetical protein [Flavisolibacter sp.]
MPSTTEPQYVIPARYRKMENMHIIFWLGKDIAWCLVWKTLGIVMIIPTLIISIVIAWRTRSIKSELAHNLAISFWISANSLWMISEFFGFDSVQIWRDFTGKHLALIPFTIGVLLLANYYLFQKRKEEKAGGVATL